MTRTRRLAALTGVASLLTVGVLAFAGTAGAQDPGEPSGGGVQPIAVAGNTSCEMLNANTAYPGVTADYGLKIDQGPWDGTYPLDGSVSGSLLTGGAPADPNNVVTVSNSTTQYFDWSASLGIDAVIVKASNAVDAFLYYPVEDFGDTALHGPVNLNVDPPQPYDISHIEFCYDYELAAAKTADASYVRTYTWDITKDFDGTYSKFIGDPDTVHGYKVSVERKAADSAFAVSGLITITNPSPSTVWFSITDVVGGTPAEVVCEAYSVAPNAQVGCSYRADLGAAVDGTNIATITATGMSDVTARADYAFGLPTSEVGYKTVDVTDTKAGPWTAGDSDSWGYTENVSCPTDKSLYTNGVYTAPDEVNTATIMQTGASDTATVKLTCYAPVVSKTAVASYDEKHTWSVVKTVDPVSQTGFVGQTLPWTWTVKVDETSVDQNFLVEGVISVANPNPTAAMTVNVADKLSDDTIATVDCDTDTGDNQTELTVVAGGTGTCTYKALPGGRTATKNYATATLNSLDFTGEATVSFEKTVVAGTATLTDARIGLNETLTAGSGQREWSGTESHTCSPNPDPEGPYGNDGTYSETVSNTATVTPSEGDSNSDSASTTYACYAPLVSKTAYGTYDEVHDWDVFKTGAAAQKKFAGQHAGFSWTVRVDETTHGENYLVTGDIVVANPNPEDAVTVALSDVLDDGTIGTIGTCTGGTLVGNELTVPAGGTATCDYSASPKGDVVDFAAGLPAQVTMKVDYPESGDPAYFEVVTLTNGGALNGTYEGWCIDQDHTINQNTNYTANVFSSYETLPAGLVEHPENFDLVNWIINQDYVYKSAAPLAGNYTYGDVQRAIWELVDDSPFSTAGIGTWSQTRVNQIKAAAIANGEGFTPTCGDFIAVVLQPVGGQQPITIAQVTFASLGVNCAESNAVTAVLNGIEFPASAEILWTGNPVKPTASLDDSQNPAWPVTVSADQTFTYADPQGYTCPADPAAYAGDGIAPVYTDSNTATLTYEEGSKSATASTSVTCYGPIVNKTAAAEWHKKYDWTITKTADPTHHVGFAGDTFTSAYDVFVDQTITDFGFAAGGTISVKNPSGSPGNMTVNVADTVSGGFPATVDCDPATAGNQTSVTVAANTTKTCSYTVDLPDNTSRTNTATGTFNSIGFPATANIVFGDPIIEGYPTINVTDDVQGPLGRASGDDTFEYNRTFSCSTNPADYTDYKDSDSYPNTATIDETGQSEGASTTVECYTPELSKTAAGTYDERHEWDVTKTASPVVQSAFAGDTVSYEWTVDVDENVFEENFVASGTITVVNHNNAEAMTVALSDVLSDGTAAAISACTGDADLSNGLTIAAGATSVCDYSAKPDYHAVGEAATDNTATAVLNGVSYFASDPVEWTADVIGANATIVDEQNPAFPLDITEGGTWQYTEEYTCSTDKAAYDETTHKYTFGEGNTATVTFTGGSKTANASTAVDCYVPTISKDANGTYDEVHDWEVFKTGQAAQKKFAGQHAGFNWTVRVDETTHGESYLVSGDIVVVNPNPEDNLTVALNDQLDDGSVASIGPCTGGTWEKPNLTVPAGGTATCDYEVTPKGDLDAFAAALPAQVTINSANPGPDSYWLTTVKNDGALNGTYESWCVDIDHTMNPGQDYTANVLSSYESLAGLLEKPENMDSVNWVINQGFVGKSAAPLPGTYTYGDVQRAIWELIEDNPTATTAGLGSWNQARVDQIEAMALASGEGFVPTCGDFVAVLLVPTGGQQPIAIAQVTFASLGVNCAESNAATAVLNGIEFPASAEILWTGNPVKPTASLDDSQNPAWPVTVSADQTFTYADPQGYTCPADPAAYAGDGIAPVYTDSNTATLTYEEGSKSATASTSVSCYAPVVDKTVDSTEWRKKYEWTITKTAAPVSHEGFAGDTFTSAYDVAVDQTITNHGFAAGGTISVKNPSGSPGNMTVNVADTVSGGFPATVDCDPATAGNQTSVTVAANTTKTCSYTVDLPDNTSRTNTATGTFNSIGFPATANIVFGDPIIEGYPTINVTDDVQGPLGRASGDDTFEYNRTFSCSTNPADYSDYKDSDSYPNTATIDETGAFDDASVQVDCYLPAKAKVVKATTEGQEEIGQLPLTFELYNPSGTKVETKTLNGAGDVAFDAELKPEGTWKVVEVLPAGWVVTPGSSNECTFAVDYWADAGKTFTCNFDDTEMSRVKLLKWTQGVIDPTKSWAFSLWEGSNGFGGTKLGASNTSGDQDGMLDFGNVDLSKYQAYTLCEESVPAGWTSFWQVDSDGDGVISDTDAILNPYNPNASNSPPQDLGNRCLNLGAGTGTDLLTAGETLLFMTNNTYPGGDPRTPGYWKNWNRVTGGGQAMNADRNGGYMKGFWLVEDVLNPNVGGGIVWDDILSDSFVFPIEAAAVAVDILDQRQIANPVLVGDGAKQSSDAGYTLATHLLAAQLNFGAGARTCDAAFDAALAGEQLLDTYNFNGTGSYLRRGADYSLALSLAKTLDEYNNGLLCKGPAVSFVEPKDAATITGNQTIKIDAMDQVPVTKVEFFVDGTSIGVDTVKSDGWSIVWDSTSVADGSRTLSAVATNSLNQAGSGDVTITVDNIANPILPKVHVGDLSSAPPTTGKAGKWNATVTVTIHDASNAGVSGAATSLMWSDGIAASCTTGSNGTCTITRSNIGSAVPSLTIGVTNVTLSGSEYDPAFNDKTSVTVTKP